MAKYVLGENAARKLRALFNGKMQAGRIDGSSGGIVDDADFLPPFTVQWAASLASGEGESATEGEWIIWLPGDQHVVIGETSIDLSEDLEDAEGEYPEGWYKLGSLLDEDEGGTLYLNVDVENEEAEFSRTPSSQIVSVKIADAEVGDGGERTVKCYVRSSVVLDGASGGEGGGNRYDGDDRSVTRYANVDPDPTQMWKDNYFHIYGFGTFTPAGRLLPIGTYLAPSDLVIGEGETTDVSFLCRTGNSSEPDENSIAYKRLKIGSASSPFQYTKTTAEDPQTHQPVTTHKIVNCRFYWEGEMQYLQDFEIPATVLSSGSVFLIGTQDAATEETPNPTWEWELDTVQKSVSEGKVLNLKLYDFSDNKPSVDYRTSFLALFDTTKKARFEVESSDGSSMIALDASGEKEKIEVGDETLELKTIKIGSSELKLMASGDQEEEEEVSVVETVNKADGNLNVIGGKGIRVNTNDKTIIIIADSTKESTDADPSESESADPCDHPDSGSGGLSSQGTRGGGVNSNSGRDTSVISEGCNNCGSGSTTGTTGSGSGQGGEGGVSPGSSGKQTSSVTSGGKKTTLEAASSGTSTSKGSSASSGLFNGSKIVKKSIGEGMTTPLYGGGHTLLSSSRTMNESPFKKQSTSN